MWKSRRQTTLALSSAEAEYVALSTCAKDVTWIRRLFCELKFKCPYDDRMSLESTKMFVDNTAAISLATNEQVSARNKHIALKVHHVRSLLKKKIVVLNHVRTAKQLADMLTKSVSSLILHEHMPSLNILGDFDNEEH